MRSPQARKYVLIEFRQLFFIEGRAAMREVRPLAAISLHPIRSRGRFVQDVVAENVSCLTFQKFRHVLLHARVMFPKPQSFDDVVVPESIQSEVTVRLDLSDKPEPQLISAKGTDGKPVVRFR